MLIHKPSSSMICADALSWRPDYEKGENDNADIILLKPEHIKQAPVVTTIIYEYMVVA